MFSGSFLSFILSAVLLMSSEAYAFDVTPYLHTYSDSPSQSTDLMITLSGAQINSISMVGLDKESMVEFDSGKKTSHFLVTENGEYKALLKLKNGTTISTKTSLVIDFIDSVSPQITAADFKEDEENGYKIYISAEDSANEGCASENSGIARITAEINGKTVAETSEQTADGGWVLNVKEKGIYRLTAYDRAGNQSDAYSVNIKGGADTEKPEIFAVSADMTYTSEDLIRVRFFVRDNAAVSTVNVKKKSGDTVSVKHEAGDFYSFMAEDREEYTIVAEDSSGNRSGFSFELDTDTLPSVYLSSDETPSQSASLYFSAADFYGIDAIYLNYKLYGGFEKSTRGCSDYIDINENGYYTVTAVNKNGLGTTEGLFITSIDKQPPLIEEITVSNIMSGRASFSVDVFDDTAVKCEWYIKDDGEWVRRDGETSSVTVTGLSQEKTYYVKVVAVDEAGNSSESGEKEFKIEKKKDSEWSASDSMVLIMILIAAVTLGIFYMTVKAFFIKR